MNIQKTVLALFLAQGHILNSMRPPTYIPQYKEPTLQAILTQAAHTPTIREEFIAIIRLMHQGETAAPQVRKRLETLIDSMCTVSELQRCVMILSFVTEIRSLPRPTTINQ